MCVMKGLIGLLLAPANIGNLNCTKVSAHFLEIAETEVSLIARILIFFRVPADVTKRPNAKNENYAFWNS